MTNFTTGDQASTAALSRVDTLLQTISTDADYELWKQWIYDRAIAKLALGLTGGGGDSTSTLAGFKAIANGTGYSIGDLIFLRQIGTNPTEYYNGTTGLVLVSAPPSDDLGPISSSSNVSITASVLPSGAATSTLQVDGNTLLTSLNSKIPSLGQALAANSTPVVLPAAQVTALTPPSTVAVSSLPSLPAGANPIGAITNTSFGISGTLPAFASTPTVNIGTAPNFTITNTSFAATQSGAWNITNISGTVSLPTGAAISANQIPAFTVSAKTLGTANAATVKASAGKVYSLSVTNLNASVRYLQIVNKATTPTNSDSASIVDVWTIPANGTIIIDSPYYGANGLSCGTGVSWAFSSTATTITLATAGDCLVSVGYV